MCFKKDRGRWKATQTSNQKFMNMKCAKENEEYIERTTSKVYVWRDKLVY